MTKDVLILTGAGQIGMAIARRMGYGKKIVIGDKSMDNAQTIASIMTNAGFDAVAEQMDLAERDSITALIDRASSYGDIAMLVNAAGVSPSQASIATILRVDLYGTAVLLEEVGKVIRPGGVGVTFRASRGIVCRHFLPPTTSFLPPPPPTSCCPSTCCKPPIYATPSTPTNWLSGATLSG